MRTVNHILMLAAACFVGGCSSSPDPKPGLPLEGTVWRLIELNGQPLTATATSGLRVPTLQLDAKSHRTGGVSGVNRYTCGYELNGSGIRFGVLAGTKMAGPPVAMAVENAYVKALGNVSSWSISHDQLVLKSAEEVLLRFQAE